MIVSVPHCGTRTLASSLGEPGFFHFIQNDIQISKLKEPVDFPVRDPLDNYVSWVCFEGNANGFFPRWKSAFDFIDSYEHGINFHIVEDLPVLDGLGPNREHPLRKVVLDKDKDNIPLDFLDFYYSERAQEFFNQFYPERWYKCEVLENTVRGLIKGRDLSRPCYMEKQSTACSSTEPGSSFDVLTGMRLA